MYNTIVYMTTSQTDIDISQSIQSSELMNNWDDFDLKPELLRGIYNYGFEKPSNIQQKAIPALISGRDIIGQAQSGTGKTGTFSIGTLHNVDVSIHQTQAILLAPTHELAKQSAKVISELGAMMPGLAVYTLIGGTSIQEDSADIKNNCPHIVVGTPGRTYDMIKRGVIDTQYVRIFVLDEADDMLSSGFKDQIYNIFQYLPQTTQIALFSATMPDEMHELSKKFMRDPIKITMKSEQLNLDCIKQYFVALGSDADKYHTLKMLFEFISLSQCIIYVNSVKRVCDLYDSMINEGYSVCCIHSSMTKSERAESFSNFKSGSYRVLISSDITARGIDIQQVSVVINFDIPKCVHTYLHRIGRSGRWGRKGLGINFVTRYDLSHMKVIENHYKSEIKELDLNNLGLLA